MSSPIKLHANEREQLLKQIVGSLDNDPRFIAAWLIGSYSRDAVDLISDLDIVLVVDDQNANVLLDKSWQENSTIPERATTTPERISLFKQYGDLLFVYENHNNAPRNGTFTTVIYSNQGVVVDWSLIPMTTAQRPQSSVLLFAKKSIPLEPTREPESWEERKRKIMGILGNFWLMMNVIVKYIYRDDALQFYAWLDAQIRSIGEIKRLLAGIPWEFRPGSSVKLSLEKKQQIKDLLQVAQMMIDLTPELSDKGLIIPGDPMQALEQRLTLL